MPFKTVNGWHKERVRSVLAGNVTLEPLLLLLLELLRWFLCVAWEWLLWPLIEPFVPEVPEPKGSAFITGCDTGIGREVALLLAQKGWRVFAGVLTETGGQQLVKASPSIVPLQMDVTKEDSVFKAAEKVAAAVGPEGLQLLINNAGLMELAPLECTDLAEVRKLLDVNVWGIFAVTQAFLPLLRKGPEKGRIINMGSVAGHMPAPFWSVYCASKHAVEGLTESLRYELANQGIKVVLIKPGPVRTPLWQDLDHSKRRDTTHVLTTVDMDKLYGTEFAAMLHEADKAAVAAVPVSTVVNVIYKAATTPHPEPKYFVGPKTWVYYWLRRIAPDRAYHAMVSKVLAAEYKKSAAVRAKQANIKGM